MRKLLLLLPILAIFAIPSQAQLGNTTMRLYPSTPTGACVALQLAKNTATGALYDCVAGVWTAVGGSGSGTVNAGTAGHLGYYATSTTAISDMGADFTFATHTLTGGASAILDLHSASSFLLPGSLSTGLVSVTTSTGAVSSVATNGTGNVVLTTSPTLVTPALGAATATSLVATGIVDGVAPVNNTTTTACTLGAASSNCGSLSFSSGYTFNQEGTAATGVTYTLPATVQGESYCVANSIVSGTGAADTGVLTVYPPASSYVIYKGTINTIGGGGTHGIASGGAAADAACFVANDATHWTVYVSSGTWTEN